MIYKHKIITLMTIFSLMSVGWGQDTTPPELTDFSFSPDTVNLSRNPVEFVIEGIDDISGFQSITLQLRHENESNTKSDYINFIGETEISDTLYLSFEDNDPDGLWYVNYIFMKDQVENNVTIDRDDLIDMGYENQIFVTYEEPSLCNEETEVELWGECYNIEYTYELDLTGNQLSGEIPTEIGQLTNLTLLRLYNNQLIGSIPTEIGNLINLEELHLGGNQLTGSIPTDIGNLTNLTELYLYNNQLTGSIPIEIGSLLNLEYWYLSGNQLSGNIPTQIGNLINLYILDFGYNNLEGSIPDEIGNLVNLGYFRIENNQITNQIPNQIGNLNNLVELFLDNNHFNGEIPLEIGNLNSIRELKLNDNQLIGQIPNSICNLDDNDNYYLNLSNNKLCPPYPECLDNQQIGYQDTLNCECLDDSIEGDLNYDGIVNISDIIILINCILSGNGCYICFDINQDSDFDVLDIIILINIILDN